jgi:hypothetical protein
MIYIHPPTRTTRMTDESDVSRPATSGAGHESAETQASENVQSLTDFFDQMDRAAFKRALANRDTRHAELDAHPQPAKRRS